MDECANCGRRMRAEALAKHNKVCTPDKPMKSVKRSSASPSAAPAAADSGTPPRPPAACPGLPIAPSPPPLPRPLGAGARRPTHPGDISEASPGSLQPGVNRTPSPAASPADAAHSSNTTVGHSPSLGSECPPSQVTPSNRSECPPSQVTPSNRLSYLDGFTGDGEGPQEQQVIPGGDWLIEHIQCSVPYRRKHGRFHTFCSLMSKFQSITNQPIPSIGPIHSGRARPVWVLRPEVPLRGIRETLTDMHQGVCLEEEGFRLEQGAPVGDRGGGGLQGASRGEEGVRSRHETGRRCCRQVGIE